MLKLTGVRTPNTHTHTHYSSAIKALIISLKMSVGLSKYINRQNKFIHVQFKYINVKYTCSVQ